MRMAQLCRAVERRRMLHAHAVQDVNTSAVTARLNKAKSAGISQPSGDAVDSEQESAADSRIWALTLTHPFQ